jgi:hypothetical protein
MIGPSVCNSTSLDGKRNLTEILHKVSVAVSILTRDFRCVRGEMRNPRVEAVMQHAIVSTWAGESLLTAETLESLRDLNHRFLDLAGTRPGGWSASDSGARAPELAGRVAQLSQEQRAAAANCPYALFDLRFQDGVYWRLRLQNPDRWRVADAPVVDADTGNFVRLALFYAWHVAASATLAPQLLLGMNNETVAAFRCITLSSLPELAATEAVNLTARWSNRRAYWSALTGAASRADGAELRRVQLYGLQLAAAARLP